MAYSGVGVGKSSEVGRSQAVGRAKMSLEPSELLVNAAVAATASQLWLFAVEGRAVPQDR